MALAFTQVQQAYKVFNEMKQRLLPDLKIHSWPTDMLHEDKEYQRNPPLLEVLGYDKKQDDGWEQIFFVVEHPSAELKDWFDQLKQMVRGNSAMSQPYTKDDPTRWVFGWF